MIDLLSILNEGNVDIATDYCDQIGLLLPMGASVRYMSPGAYSGNQLPISHASEIVSISGARHRGYNDAWSYSSIPYCVHSYSGTYRRANSDPEKYRAFGYF